MKGRYIQEEGSLQSLKGKKESKNIGFGFERVISDLRTCPDKRCTG